MWHASVIITTPQRVNEVVDSSDRGRAPVTVAGHRERDHGNGC